MAQSLPRVLGEILNFQFLNSVETVGTTGIFGVEVDASCIVSGPGASGSWG